MNAMIHDRGRGPEIVGTRITVYDVLDYAETHTPEFIADLFKLEVAQIHAALAYIDAHRDEVMARYVPASEWVQPPYTPELQAKLDRAEVRGEALRSLYREDRERCRELLALRNSNYDEYARRIDAWADARRREVDRVSAPG